jgi:DNA-binding Lrp family transcriptional regulator
MRLKPQDVVIALKLALKEEKLSYQQLGEKLKLSASMVHSAVRRLQESGLVEAGTHRVNRYRLRMFLLHGVPYAFPARLREISRGVPTAWGLADLFPGLVETGSGYPVWPDSDGDAKGPAVAPLYKGAVHAARQDEELHRLLALVDAVRTGRARERKMAEDKLQKLLSADATS